MEVAPLAGSVDRNMLGNTVNKFCPVAPLAGSVDRNHTYGDAFLCIMSKVAPLAGSVDRNLEKAKAEIEAQGSLPSRGAWIEIHFTVSSTARKWVAPLAGSVDRNGQAFNDLTEIQVAPLAGSVDRNLRHPGADGGRPGRSPRGERG